eukprot:scaffold124237_cov24-Phaeocystis_antarctica.AAC.1
MVAGWAVACSAVAVESAGIPSALQEGSTVAAARAAVTMVVATGAAAVAARARATAGWARVVECSAAAEAKGSAVAATVMAAVA